MFGLCLSSERKFAKVRLPGAAGLPAVRAVDHVRTRNGGASGSAVEHVDAVTTIGGSDEARRELAVLREGHHQLRDAEGEVVAVDLPHVERFAVRLDEIVEV